MGRVGGFECGNLLAAQFDLGCGDGFVQLIHLGGTDDRAADAGFVQHPRQGNLGWLDPVVACDRIDRVEHLEIGFLIVHVVGKGIGFGTGGVATFVGSANGSVCARVVSPPPPRLRLPAKNPRAIGLHGISPMP